MTIIQSEAQAEYKNMLNEVGQDAMAFIFDLEFEILPTFLPSNWKASFVTFKNCRFRSHLYFTGIDLRSGIEFQQCIFERGVSFEECTAGEHAVLLSDGSPFSVSLSSCQLKYLFITNLCSFQHAILIHRESVLGSIELSNTILSGVWIENSTIESSFEANDLKLSDRFYFQSAEFKSWTKIARCQANLELINSKFHDEFALQRSDIRIFITKGLEFKEAFKLIGCQVATFLRLNDCTFEKVVTISNVIEIDERLNWFNNLDLENCDFKGGLDYEGSQTQQTGQLGCLAIRCGDRLKGNLNFYNLRIGQVIIGGINTASIVLAYSYLTELQLVSFINKGALTLVSLCPTVSLESLIYISKSLLGNTFISDCDLSSFTSITITHSNLTELKTTSVIWFRDEQLNTKNPIDLLFTSPPAALGGEKAVLAVAFHVKKDLYRQLKFAMEKQGDQFNRLRFKKEELTAYRKEIGQYTFRQKGIGDRLILWLNRSNDYGFNWLKPAAWMLGITMFFYCLLAIEINPALQWQLNLKNSASTFQYLVNNLYNYFSLLNPAHKVTELFNIKTVYQPSFWFYLCDFGDRIVISYLIFQTITAFRKYIL